MEIAELILLLQHEVQRSYDLVEDSIRKDNPNPVYINVERLEIDLPVMVTEGQRTERVADLKKAETSMKKFQLPFSAAQKGRAVPVDELLKSIRAKELKGPTLRVRVVGEDEDLSGGKENRIGRLRLVLKPLPNT